MTPSPAALARRWGEPAVIAGTTLLMLAAALRSLDHLNPDAVSYIRIARYWAQGDVEHALNAYWGPVLSWLVLPLDRAAHAALGPTAGAHCAMVVSGLLFTLACRAWFAIALDGRALRLAALAVAGAFALLASVLVITPDLLMAAIGIAAAATLARPAWRTRTATQALAGALLGAAYLTKAVALPFSILLVPACALALVLGHQARLRDMIRPVAVTMAVLLLVAAPWIAAISHQAGKPTFSSSGAIGHAIVGPGQTGDQPYITTIHPVPPGRVTVWEDPSREPYPYWSPLGSRALMDHQLRLLKQNVIATLAVVSAIDPLRLGLLGVLATLLMLAARRTVRPEHAVGACVVLLLPMLYLPVYTGELRYLLLLVPILVAAALRLAAALDVHLFGRFRANLGPCCAIIAAASLASALPIGAAVLARGWTDPELATARQILRGLAKAGLPFGPPGTGIASTGTTAAGPWRVGLDTAFLGTGTFNGNAARLPPPDALRTLGIRYVLTAPDDDAATATLGPSARRILPELAGARLYDLAP